MKLFSKSILVLLAVSSAALSASSQIKTMDDVRLDSTIASHKVIYFGKGEEPSAERRDTLIRRFYEDQFRHFQDPLAPYFLFMSKDSNLAMGVGGAVRMRGYYDWGGSIPSGGFAPYLIPMGDNPLRERYFGTTPAGSSLFFRVIGTNKTLGNYQLYIEANFNGYEARDFHLKKAYGVINDWTIGYANSTFSDPSALPPAIDAQGPNSKLSVTTVLVRWCHNFRSHWSLAASVEAPTDAVDTDDVHTAKVEQYVPDFSAFGQYEWGSSHVRLSAIARTLSYRDLLQGKNHNRLGWAAQLSGKVAPHERFTFYGAVNGGEGYEGLGGDLMIGKYDLVGDPDHPGAMYAPWSVGGYFGMQVNVNPNMFFSATYSGARYLPRGPQQGSEYKTGQYVAVNWFWFLTTRISCGAEFNLGRRENMDGESRWARRAGAFVQFSF